MKKTALAGAMGAAVMLSATVALAESPFDDGDMAFTPLAQSAVSTAMPDAATPWLLPEGYTQTLVAGETAGCRNLDIYGDGLNDWPDMNTVNESGPKAGRYLFRTHEVRLRTPGADERYPAGGAVSVVDLESCSARVIAQDPTYTALDGIEWTPWGTVLFAEETTGGRLFELIPNENPMSGGTVEYRPAVGLMAHEGIAVDGAGNVYVVDEFRGQREGNGGGGVYRFTPDRFGDLSSGTLAQLTIIDGDTFEGTGQFEWREIDPADVRNSGKAVGATAYNRPEDLEIIDNTLYVAVTEGTYTNGAQNYDGRVLAVDLDEMVVSNYVMPGVNVPIERANPANPPFTTGFDNPDNLASDDNGNLWIVEDNNPSDIWLALGDGPVAEQVGLFASLTDAKAEGTGIYFGTEDDVLYVNVQHAAYADGDGTWAITKADDDDQADGHDD